MDQRLSASSHGDSGHASIIDVAAVAGVSKSTASRALLGQPGVSDRTKEHVLETARRLGYVKDLRAQSLKSGRSDTVAILVRAVQLSYYGELIRTVQETLAARGFRLAVTMADPRDERPLDAVMSLRPEGVIIASGRVGLEDFADLSDVPVVVVGPEAVPPRLSAISDDGSGVRALIELVVAEGHQRIGVIDIPRSRSTTLGARSDAFIEAVRAHSIDPVIIRAEADGDGPDPRALRDVVGDVTVIVCPSDPILVRTWELLHSWGLDVPDDISLTGYDGLGDLARPVIGVTTWMQPVEAMGRAAAEEIMARIGGRPTPTRQQFRGALIRGRTLKHRARS